MKIPLNTIIKGELKPVYISNSLSFTMLTEIAAAHAPPQPNEFEPSEYIKYGNTT